MTESTSPEVRLALLGIDLPHPVPPVANYVPWTLHNGLVTLSGQLPRTTAGTLVTGVVGLDVEVEDAVLAARLCAINLLANLRVACGGDLGRVRAVVRLGGFVNAVPGFTDHPKVINGASDLMVAVFGDGGRHARSAVGVASLPLGVPVEVDAQVLIDLPRKSDLPRKPSSAS